MEETTLSGPFRHLSCAGDNDTGEARLVPRARNMPGLQGAGSLVTNISPLCILRQILSRLKAKHPGLPGQPHTLQS